MGFEAVRIVSGKMPGNESFSVKVYLFERTARAGLSIHVRIYFPCTKVSEAQCLYAKTRAFSLMPGFELQQRFHRLIFAFCASGFISRTRTFHLFAMVLQCVKLIVSAVFLKQLMMIALFNDFPFERTMILSAC